MSRELIDKLKSRRIPEVSGVDSLLHDIDSNLEKIHHLVKRTEGIVKGMLKHSPIGAAFEGAN